jgi:hydroxyacylglutathione hydrolase
MPVYDDALLSVRSVNKLKTIRGIRVLLSSWDEPRKEGNSYRQMDLALKYLQHIHEVVLDSAGMGNPDLMELTIKSAAILGLPPTAVSPLLTRTFAANLRIREQKNLLSDF